MTMSSRESHRRPGQSPHSPSNQPGGQSPAGQGSGQPPNSTLLDLEAGGSPDPGGCCPLAATPQRCNTLNVI